MNWWNVPLLVIILPADPLTSLLPQLSLSRVSSWGQIHTSTEGNSKHWGVFSSDVLTECSNKDSSSFTRPNMYCNIRWTLCLKTEWICWQGSRLRTPEQSTTLKPHLISLSHQMCESLLLLNTNERLARWHWGQAGEVQQEECEVCTGTFSHLNNWDCWCFTELLIFSPSEEQKPPGLRSYSQ